MSAKLSKKTDAGQVDTLVDGLERYVAEGCATGKQLRARYSELETKFVSQGQSFTLHARELRQKIDDLADEAEWDDGAEIRALHAYVRGLERAFHAADVLLSEAIKAGLLAVRIPTGAKAEGEIGG